MSRCHNCALLLWFRSALRLGLSFRAGKALFISNALLHILMRRIRGYLFCEVDFLPYHMHAAQLPVAMHLAPLNLFRSRCAGDLGSSLLQQRRASPESTMTFHVFPYINVSQGPPPSIDSSSWQSTLHELMHARLDNGITIV